MGTVRTVASWLAAIRYNPEELAHSFNIRLIFPLLTAGQCRSLSTQYDTAGKTTLTTFIYLLMQSKALHGIVFTSGICIAWAPLLCLASWYNATVWNVLSEVREYYLWSKNNGDKRRENAWCGIPTQRITDDLLLFYAGACMADCLVGQGTQ